VRRRQTLQKSLAKLKSKKVRTFMESRFYRAKRVIEENLTGQ